ncbi:hypothetical protein D3C72_1784170 [compost metagenome]
MSFLWDDHGRVATEYLVLAVGALLDVVEAALALEQLQPGLCEDVGVDIDDRHLGGSCGV